MGRSPVRGMEDVPSVAIKAVLAAKPDLSLKVDVKAHFNSCDSSKLLVDFLDGMSHSDYVDSRRDMVVKLAALACLVMESGDLGKMEAESSARRRLVDSLEYFSGQEKRNNLTIVARVVKSSEDMPVMSILEKLDLQFASPNAVVRSREFENALGELTVWAGKPPSAICSEAFTLFRRKFGHDQEKLVETELRSWFVSTITAQNERCKKEAGVDFLEVVVSRLRDLDFQTKSLTAWQDQFRMYESDPGFAAGMAAAKKKGGSVAVRPTSTSKGVNALTGSEVVAADVDRAAGANLLSDMIAAIDRLRAAQAPATPPPTSGVSKAGEERLHALVAAMHGGGKPTPEERDAAWVKANGGRWLCR
jgi:hypothetical protein